jgi:hypothetical protein
MSTRSIIAISNGDGWKGRYCHSDGYPSWNGRVLWNAIAKHPDGPEKAIAVLEEFLSDNGPGAFGISFISDDSFLADMCLASWEDRPGGAGNPDGNVRVYKGRPGEDGPGWWYDNTKSDREEYLYVASLGGLMVFETHRDGDKLLGTFRYDEPEPDWDAVENSEED